MRKVLNVFGFLPFTVLFIFCMGMIFSTSIVWIIAVPMLICLLLIGYGVMNPKKRWQVTGLSALAMLVVFLCYQGFNNDYFYLAEVYVAGFLLIYFSVIYALSYWQHKRP